MKKSLLSLVVLSVLIMISQNVMAFCLVRIETDNANNQFSLRYNAEKNYKVSTCATGDTDLYDSHLKLKQAILFQTLEWGSIGGVVIDINNLVLKDKITFDNSSSNLVIGNWPKIKPDASTYAYNYPDTYHPVVDDYGMVEIDAKTNFDPAEHPFECKKDSKDVVTTKDVVLRSLIIITNGINKADFFKKQSCLKDGGAVYVCGGTKVGNPPEAGWCDETSNGGANGGGNVKKEICDNFDHGVAIDDNGDGLANCVDPTCDCAPVSEDCFKDGDEDKNGYADCKDAACAETSKCQNTSEVESDPLACSDLADNDKDGKTDCDDDGCAAYCQGPVEICDDLDPITNEGIDNNGDGLINCADPTCKIHDDKCNHAVEDVCNDHLDNDHDGTIDCNDTDCANEDVCKPPVATETSCADKIDNDEDTLVDCADNDCDNDLACAPENSDLDGDGFSKNAGDCNDNDNTVYPGNKETCGDSKDNNCDTNSTAIPLIDEGCAGDPTEDDDGDGFCENTEKCATTDIKPGDCDDTNKAINPEAVEICDDNINNDCDASTSDAGAAADPTVAGTVNPLIKKVLDGGGLSCSIGEPLPTGNGGSGGGCGCDISQKAGASHQFNLALVLLAFMISLIPVGLRIRKKN